MSGVAVIRALLAASSPVTAVAPAASIVCGDLPQGTPLPGIEIKQISGVPRLTVAMTEAGRLHTDRVQVTALLKGPQGTPAGTGYPGVKALLALVLAACPNQRGSIAGVAVDSILPDVVGPDLSDPAASLYSQSQDFIVKYT